MKSNTLQRHYTVAQAAEIAAMHPDTIRNLCRIGYASQQGRGLYEAVKIGKSWRIPAAGMVRLLNGEVTK